MPGCDITCRSLSAPAAVGCSVLVYGVSDSTEDTFKARQGCVILAHFATRRTVCVLIGIRSRYPSTGTRHPRVHGCDPGTLQTSHQSKSLLYAERSSGLHPPARRSRKYRAAQIIFTRACSTLYGVRSMRLVLRKGFSNRVSEAEIGRRRYGHGFALMLKFYVWNVVPILCHALLLVAAFTTRDWRRCASFFSLSGPYHPPGSLLGDTF